MDYSTQFVINLTFIESQNFSLMHLIAILIMSAKWGKTANSLFKVTVF